MSVSSHRGSCFALTSHCARDGSRWAQALTSDAPPTRCAVRAVRGCRPDIAELPALVAREDYARLERQGINIGRLEARGELEKVRAVMAENEGPWPK